MKWFHESFQCLDFLHCATEFLSLIFIFSSLHHLKPQQLRFERLTDDLKWPQAEMKTALNHTLTPRHVDFNITAALMSEDKLSHLDSTHPGGPAALQSPLLPVQRQSCDAGCERGAGSDLVYSHVVTQVGPDCSIISSFSLFSAHAAGSALTSFDWRLDAYQWPERLPASCHCSF